jgi:hypothetical protein
MAATVATPLERHLGSIADVTGMSVESAVGITRITLQFTLNRSLDGAARDVAINAARADPPLHDGQVPEWLAGRMTRLGTGSSYRQSRQRGGPGRLPDRCLSAACREKSAELRICGPSERPTSAVNSCYHEGLCINSLLCGAAEILPAGSGIFCPSSGIV